MPNSILSPVSFSSWFDSTTGAVVQADVFFYTGGTTDLTTVYQDALMTQPWAQPIRTTGNGRLPPVFIPEIASYRIRVYDLDDVLLEDEDGLPGAEPDPAEVPDPIATDQTALLVTGDIIASFSNNVGSTPSRTNFVRCNGGTISKAGSGGTELASADAEALFLWLWGQDAANVLVIQDSSGTPTTKGGTAGSDWLAGKRMPLPDLRGRALAGMTNMGSNIGTSARLSASFFGQTGLSPGHAGGAESHQLTAAQLATHGHLATSWQDPHLHLASSYNDHTHTFSPMSANTTGDYGLVTSAQVTGSVGYANRTLATASGGVPGTGTTSGISTTILSQTDNRQPTVYTTVHNMTGGDNAHNNVQPTMALMFYMRL